MKKILNIMSLTGLVICAAPIVQIFLFALIPSDLGLYEIDSWATLLFIGLFAFFAIAPILFFHFLMNYFYIEKKGGGANLWGQVSVGLLAVFLYFIPVLLSLAWVTDFDRFRTSDGLNGIAYFVIIIYSSGLSILPAIVLAIPQRQK